jgi:hypothetical protein
MQPGFRAQRDKTPFDKLAQAFARTRLGGWLFINVFPSSTAASSRSRAAG